MGNDTDFQYLGKDQFHAVYGIEGVYAVFRVCNRYLKIMLWKKRGALYITQIHNLRSESSVENARGSKDRASNHADVLKIEIVERP